MFIKHPLTFLLPFFSRWWKCIWVQVYISSAVNKMFTENLPTVETYLLIKHRHHIFCHGRDAVRETTEKEWGDDAGLTVNSAPHIPSTGEARDNELIIKKTVDGIQTPGFRSRMPSVWEQHTNIHRAASASLISLSAWVCTKNSQQVSVVVGYSGAGFSYKLLPTVVMLSFKPAGYHPAQNGLCSFHRGTYEPLVPLQ